MSIFAFESQKIVLRRYQNIKMIISKTQNIFRTYMLIFMIGCVSLVSLTAQEDYDYKTTQVVFDGKVYTAMISSYDTIILQQLEDVSISAPRTFEDYDEYRKYIRYRRYAQKVYPYAVEAIKIFRELEVATKDLNRRKSRRHVRRLQKDLKREFSDPLKNLTKTQGLILTKMIERELDTPMYDLIKDLKGGFTALYYNQFGKLYGYKLKEGYIEGDDKIMDIVLQDYNISYEVPK